MTDAPMPPGWYHGEGDPVGTKRYWDGSTWIGEPQAMVADTTTATDTPGGVAGGPALANPWKRLGGRAIDWIIMFIVSAIVGFIVGAGVSDDPFAFSGAAIAGGVVAAIIAFLYEAVFVSRMGGTPGKLILGMQVVDAATGVSPPPDPTGWKRAANQLLAAIPVVNLIAGIIIGLVSLVFLFSDDKHRTVMDRFADTLVVEK